jgi:hypothetical protein
MVASRNRRTDETQAFDSLSFRIGENFVRACAKASPSASKALLGRWRDGNGSNLGKNQTEFLQNIPSAQPALL